MMMLSVNYFTRCLMGIGLLLLSFSIQAAAPALVLDDALAKQEEPLYLLDYSVILPDPKGQLTLADVLTMDGSFVASEAENGKLDFFMTRTAYWIKVNVHNRSSKENWYFTHSGSLSRQLDVYLKPAGKDEVFEKPKHLPNARSLQYLLPLSATGNYQLYFRVSDRQAPLLIEPRLRSPSQMLLDVLKTYPLYSFFIGGLLTLAVYNLLYFLYLGDRSFFALSVFTCVRGQTGNVSFRATGLPIPPTRNGRF